MAEQYAPLSELEEEQALSLLEDKRSAEIPDIIHIDERRRKSAMDIGEAATAQVLTEPQPRSNRIRADYCGPRNRRFQVLDAIRRQEAAKYERWFHAWSKEVKNRPAAPKNYDP